MFTVKVKIHIAYKLHLRVLSGVELGGPPGRKSFAPPTDRRPRFLNGAFPPTEFLSLKILKFPLIFLLILTTF